MSTTAALQEHPLDRLYGLIDQEKSREGGPELSTKSLPLRVSRILAREDTESEKSLSSEQNVAGMISRLQEESLLGRARQHAAYIGNTDTDYNKQKLEKIFKRLAYDDKGQKVPVKEFEKRLYNIYGLVLTGHPVFEKSAEESGNLAKLFTLMANGKDDPETKMAIQEAEQNLLASSKKPSSPPTIDDESDQSLATLANIHAAISIAEDVAIEVGREEYPQEWKTINYMPVTTGTWIPFDRDGRTDISWQKSFEKRLGLQTKMFNDDLMPRFEELIGSLEKNEHISKIKSLVSRLKFSAEKVEGHQEFFRNYDDKKDKRKEAIIARNKEIIKDTEERIIHPSVFIESLQEIIDGGVNEKAEHLLIKLRSRLTNHGISYAQEHSRTNSKAIGTALRENVPVEEDMTGSEIDKIYGQKIEAKLAAGIIQKQSNFLDLARPGSAIYKQNIAARQIHDHFDSNMSYRGLIAENANATAPLGAISIQQEVGTDGFTETCPLTEDWEGASNLANTLRGMYGNPQYLARIRKISEGSLQLMPQACFQLGYSDAGREIGQFAAGAFMDLSQGRILKQHHESGCSDTMLVMFHTHGESMGRGAHPASVKDRMAYLATGNFMHEAKTKGIKVKIEESFQGGDGFLLHGTPEASLAYITQALDHLTADHSHAKNDLYYNRENSQDHKNLRAFIRCTQSKHKLLSGDQDYKDMIVMFQSFLYQTGSRPVKRQGNGKTSTRAIPHNAAMQQLGSMAEVIYGVADAINQFPEVYDKLLKESPEFRLRMRLVYHALDMADPAILSSYIELYTPSFWNKMAQNEENKARKENYYSIADTVEKLGYYQKFYPIITKICRNHEFLMEKRSALNLFDDPEMDEKYQSFIVQRNKKRDAAHAIRMHSIIELFRLSAETPEISDAEVASRASIVHGLLHLNKEVVDSLKQIFEARREDDEIEDIAEKPSELSRAHIDYSNRILGQFIEPIERHLRVASVESTGIVADLHACYG